jgi:predicted nucleic acid-binding protein
VNVLLDTNILTRAIQPAHAHHAAALSSLDLLKGRAQRLCVVPQNLYEFWVVCTRPEGENGLGMTTGQAETECAQIKSLFTLLPEQSEIFPRWERLVIDYDVKGKSAHDARLVAAMQVHGLTHLLTFNAGDFARYRDISVLVPEDVVAGRAALG